MIAQLFTINSRKYDLSLRKSWSANLVRRNELYLVLEGVFDSDVEHPDLGTIAKNTRSVETFFYDRWYNYFAFYEPTGELRNYYINISAPPLVSDSSIDYIDLDIDVIVWPDGKVEVLDQDEFEENSVRYAYPEEVVALVTSLSSEISTNPEKFLSPIIA